MQPTEVNRYIEVNRNLVLVCFCPSLPKDDLFTWPDIPCGSLLHYTVC